MIMKTTDDHYREIYDWLKLRDMLYEHTDLHGGYLNQRRSTMPHVLKYIEENLIPAIVSLKVPADQHFLVFRRIIGQTDYGLAIQQHSMKMVSVDLKMTGIFSNNVNMQPMTNAIVLDTLVSGVLDGIALTILNTFQSQLAVTE